MTCPLSLFFFPPPPGPGMSGRAFLGIPEERTCQVVHYVYAALGILRNIKLRLCVASIAGPLLGAVGRLAGLVDTGLSVPLSGPLASRRRHRAGFRAPRIMRRQLSAYSGCCQFGTPKRPRKSDLAGERLRRAGLRRRLRRAGPPAAPAAGFRGYISGVSGPPPPLENLRLGTINFLKVATSPTRSTRL